MGDGITSRRYRHLRKRFKEQCAQADAPCWLCGQPIDYTLARLDPYTNTVNDDAFELDHLYPRSTHPHLAEDPANFRPSHAGCNRERGNKNPKPGLGATSRTWLKPKNTKTPHNAL